MGVDGVVVREQLASLEGAGVVACGLCVVGEEVAVPGGEDAVDEAVLVLEVGEVAEVRTHVHLEQVVLGAQVAVEGDGVEGEGAVAQLVADLEGRQEGGLVALQLEGVLRVQALQLRLGRADCPVHVRRPHVDLARPVLARKQLLLLHPPLPVRHPQQVVLPCTRTRQLSRHPVRVLVEPLSDPCPRSVPRYLKRKHRPRLFWQPFQAARTPYQHC